MVVLGALASLSIAAVLLLVPGAILVRALRPTAIVGVAAVAGTFTQAVIEEMTRLNEHPIVFALSNPTSKSECTAQQAYEWSGGQALIALTVDSAIPQDVLAQIGEEEGVVAAGDALVRVERAESSMTVHEIADLCRAAPVVTAIVTGLTDVPSTKPLSTRSDALYYGTANGRLTRINVAEKTVTVIADLKPTPSAASAR